MDKCKNKGVTHNTEENKKDKNPMEGKKVVFIHDNNDQENADGLCGHLVAVGNCEYNTGLYDRYIKRMIDIFLSGAGLIVLFPFFVAISIAIKIDDSGPILFMQKRIGKNKKYFNLHKFRTMKMSTPHDVPTHMLDNPEQYITQVGRWMRRTSIDELPQIWDIFVGNMSIIGPRPALWNQDVLVAERDRYNANNLKPGLTGWAQINGRDELDIATKAMMDGEYVVKESFLFDCCCFWRTFSSVFKSKGVVEGRANKKKQEKSR